MSFFPWVSQRYHVSCLEILVDRPLAIATPSSACRRKLDIIPNLFPTELSFPTMIGCRIVGFLWGMAWLYASDRKKFWFLCFGPDGSETKVVHPRFVLLASLNLRLYDYPPQTCLVKPQGQENSRESTATNFESFLGRLAPVVEVP
ncbi:hypothetical protein AG1IA_08414 [Rhizoctonia solani AG-1 IA]|uniref:Uncharacterized protein n=1 Tax=Thanatephorus cucumeris (strain AG1-IA) TaxID=983506 RepID=L8WHX7_THACA|nr:hypothetical protein AG1IA_08414 [Rhizoctonia solani AG-1 IA]